MSTSLVVEPHAPQYGFGAFRFAPETGELWRGAEPLHLRRQAAEVLAALLRRPGQLVSRDELRAAVACGSAFGGFDQGVNDCIREVRAALGDPARAPIYIDTLPRRGYRFRAAVRLLRADSASSGAPEPTREQATPQAPGLLRPPERAGFALGLGVVALLLATLAVGLWAG